MDTERREFGIGWRGSGGPGKFEGGSVITELAYEASLNGGPDEESGSVQESGWYGLLRGPLAPDAECNAAEREDLARMAGVILYEDGQGFVDAEWYGPGEENRMEEAWNRVVAAEDEDAEEDEDAS